MSAFLREKCSSRAAPEVPAERRFIAKSRWRRRTAQGRPLVSLDANTVALVGCLGPVFTIAFGHALLGERIHALQLAGAAAVLAGVLLVTWRKRDPAPQV